MKSATSLKVIAENLSSGERSLSNRNSMNSIFISLWLTSDWFTDIIIAQNTKSLGRKG